MLLPKRIPHLLEAFLFARDKLFDYFMSRGTHGWKRMDAGADTLLGFTLIGIAIIYIIKVKNTNL